LPKPGGDAEHPGCGARIAVRQQFRVGLHGW
jgi:hypothetical protein